jgi:hypothetical protein
LFDAEIVWPFKCLAQLNAPMPGTGVHFDLPLFRGFGAPNHPVWLLMNMAYSALFHDWMVPVASDLLHYAGEGIWEIRDGERVAHRLEPEQLRISLLWKARVFRDEVHLASFEDRAMDFSLDQVVEIYLDDLAARGVAASRPADPLGDAEWKRVLEAYPQPLSAHAGDGL